MIDCDAATASAAERESFDVLCVDDIGLDANEFRRMAGIYNVLELSTAIKPWLLRHLLDEGSGPVVYLDPDVEIFTPIGDAAELAAAHGIVLTPHTVAPTALDDLGPDELTILQSGVYNLGFIAVGPGSVDFLDWWATRLRRDCLISKAEGMFVDQRWIDLVPSYFEPHVLRDPGWNVAYWNLSARQLSATPDGYLVNDVPLRLFHYSGFDPDRPDRLSHYLGPSPRIRLEDHPVLAELCAGYADRLIGAGHRAHSRVRYPFDRTASGIRLDRRARLLYRKALMKSERDGGPSPPDPFDADRSEAFEDWLNEREGPHGVTRYLRALYDEREALQTAFPYIDGVDGRRFVDWVRATGGAHEEIPDRLFTAPSRTAALSGVDISGYMAAENGVGEAARRYVDAFAAAGVPHTLFAYRNTKSRQEVAANAHVEPAYDLNLVVVNADQLPTFVHDTPSDWTEGYTIGQWAWEVERLPAWMADSTVHVDEIWMCSEHAARAIRPHTGKPVLVMPPPVVPPRVRPISRAELGLPDGFMFLFCFDFDSVFERKNPMDVVEAFRRAFPTPCGLNLVIKSVRGDAHPEQLASLREAARGRADIRVVDGYLSADHQAALMAACDAYVSLHRAEGFGFTLAEAMALGKPVIATGYSGNLEFMDETNSWLVPYALVPIGPGCDPYPADARWAGPDLDAAANAMREIVADPAGARERGRRAADDIARLHGPHARVPLLIDRLEKIAALRDRWAAGDDGRVWQSVVHARRDLSAAPDIDTPARYGRISRAWRRLVLRMLRHFTEHQERLRDSLLESVRDLETRLAAEITVVRELEAKIQRLEGGEAVGEGQHGVGRPDVRPLRTDAEPANEQGGVVRPLRERRG